MADSSSNGLHIAPSLAWLNKAGSDFKNGFEQKTKKKLNELPVITRMLFLRIKDDKG